MAEKLRAVIELCEFKRLAEGAEEELDELLAERQWQPIETAPRDGRDFLVLTASGPVVAHWRDESVTIIGARRGSRGHVLRSPEGWILSGVTSRTVIVEPTHWMPLPARPPTGDDK